MLDRRRRHRVVRAGATQPALALAVITVIACQSGDTSRGAPATKVVFRQLGHQPVEAAVPDDARIEDRSMMGPDDGGTNRACVAIHSPGEICAEMNVRPEEDEPSLVAYPDIVFTKKQRTADGSILEFTFRAASAPGVTSYGVRVHKTIAGVPWECGVETQSKSELAEAEELCSTLRVAKM